MGLVIGTAKIFYEICKKHQLRGSILTLGHQRILVTPEQAMGDNNMPLIDYKDESSTEFHLRWKKTYTHPNAFFKACGFSSVDSLDVSNYEGASILLDLNSDTYKQEHREKFDVIFDGSTLEHVFCLQNALQHIVNMTKVGGYIIHMSPCNNFIYDGFFQFSPNFFKEFYKENGFSICSLLYHQFVDIDSELEAEGIFETSDRLIEENELKGHSENKILLETPFNPGLPTQLIVVCRKELSLDKIKFPYQERYLSKSYWASSLEDVRKVK